MSYDINVSFKAWPDDAQALWVAEMRRLGITVEAPDDTFKGSGWVPLKVTVESGATIPWADQFRERGTFDSGFERSRTVKRVSLSAKSAEGNAGAIWSAVALAAVVGGTVEDPQAGVTAKGPRAVDILATLMRNEAFVKSFAGPSEMGELPPPGPFKAPLPQIDVALDESKPTRDYAASASYEVGDQVTHPKFGEGVVEVAEVGKVTIAFRSGRRVLAQSKTVSDIPKPNRIDHSLPTPGSKPSK